MYATFLLRQLWYTKFRLHLLICWSFNKVNQAFIIKVTCIVTWPCHVIAPSSTAAFPSTLWTVPIHWTAGRAAEELKHCSIIMRLSLYFILIHLTIQYHKQKPSRGGKSQTELCPARPFIWTMSLSSVLLKNLLGGINAFAQSGYRIARSVRSAATSPLAVLAVRDVVLLSAWPLTSYPNPARLAAAGSVTRETFGTVSARTSWRNEMTQNNENIQN